MDEEEVSSDLQSILTFGAKALFEESEVSDINCESSMFLGTCDVQLMNPFRY